MARKETKITELKGKIDFGIITIREDEFEAVLKRLPTEALLTGRQTYALSRLQTTNDDEYLIASVRCPEQGNGQGQSVAHTLIEELDPQWILLVGIAGSVPDYEYTLGDVLLATRLHDFSVSASLEDSNQQVTHQFAIKGGPMHPAIQSLLGALPALEPFLEQWNTKESLTLIRPTVKTTPSNLYGDEKWKRKVRECLSRYFGKNPVRQQPKAFTGSIASSDTLVKDTRLVSKWQETARQINGIEMELAGVYQAAWVAQKPVLAIRGISDIVGFKRSPDWTSYACNSAAAFMLSLLRYRPIAPHSAQEPSNKVDRQHDSLQSQPVGVFKNVPPNPPPVVKQERLYSNLLEVSYFPDRIYSVQTSCEDRAEVWSLLRDEIPHPPEDWVYKGKALYAFHDFSDPVWKNACDVSTVEPHNTSHWADAADQNRIAEFIELLKGCLKEFGRTRDLYYIHTQKVNGDKKKFKFLYYAPTSELSESPIFRASDFLDPHSLISSLKDEQTPLAKHLLASMPTHVREAIKKYSGSPDKELLTNLVNGFNDLLKGTLYEPSHFEGVFLRRETSKLIDGSPAGEKEITHLNRMLLEDAYRHDIAKRYLSTRTIVMQSVFQSRPRDVFKPYFSKKTGNLSYYRHHAFKFHFERYEGQWYMEITPTYHYTWNGYRVSRYYEDLIKGIKRIEKNEAVFRQVMFWSRVLQDNKSEFLEQREYPYLRFGKLLEYRFDYGVRDDLWIKKESLGKTEMGDSIGTGRRGGRSRGRPDSQSSNSLFT